MKKTILTIILLILIMAYYVVSKSTIEEQKAEITNSQKVCVKEVIAKSECNYIVKDEITYSILEPKEYLDEEVTGIAVCDDTENTICIFVAIENEKLHIRK